MEKTSEARSLEGGQLRHHAKQSPVFEQTSANKEAK
jgi:hypothetical protein